MSHIQPALSLHIIFAPVGIKIDSYIRPDRGREMASSSDRLPCTCALPLTFELGILLIYMREE